MFLTSQGNTQCCRFIRLRVCNSFSRLSRLSLALNKRSFDTHLLQSETSNFQLCGSCNSKRRICYTSNSKLLEALENTVLCVMCLLFVILLLNRTWKPQRLKCFIFTFRASGQLVIEIQTLIAPVGAFRNYLKQLCFKSNWQGIGCSLQLAITAPLYSITGYCVATAQSYSRMNDDLM